MSDERFILCQDDLGNYEIRYDDKVFHFLWEVAPILNDQEATIIKQDEEIKKLKRTERSWRRIHCCNKESDNCGIVIEQQATINQLKEELKLEQDFTSRWQKESEMLAKENERLKQKIQRWKNLYEIKDKEVTARVKRLNEICNQYKYAITFDKDIDPNDAVNILCDRILQTEVE